MIRGLAMAGLLLPSLLVTCQRKAPGPYACHRFALQALGVPDGAELTPQAYAAIDELTRECITTPYDRALLRCVDDGLPPRRCLADFQLRSGRREER